MEREHIVKAYDDELNQLDNLIAEMGGLAEAHLAAATEALIARDETKAESVIEGDEKIDALERKIDSAVVRLVALRQPMAEDLRIVLAALKISASIERIGDYAKNIAKRTTALTQIPATGAALNSVARMSRLVQSMLKSVLDAYLTRDAERAMDVRNRDEEVDQLHTSLFRELLTYMMENAGNITACTHLLFVAKNIERIGDHATTIAEQVIFLAEGEPPGEKRHKQDKSSLTVVEADEIEEG